MSRTPRPRILAAAGVAAALLLSACGDDGAADATDNGKKEATSTTIGKPGVVEVTAVDYGFEGLPETIPAGTKLTFENSSAIELHELVVMRIPDDEKRSVEELTKLPEEEVGQIFTEEPATVLLAPPDGGEQVDAVGDGTIAEPGRYAVVCFIPTGADPVTYMQQAGPEGPPEGSGPPHIVHGMFAELTVE
jgi:hypothetical protein